jgi:hypothetical protein
MADAAEHLAILKRSGPLQRVGQFVVIFCLTRLETRSTALAEASTAKECGSTNLAGELGAAHG